MIPERIGGRLASGSFGACLMFGALLGHAAPVMAQEPSRYEGDIPAEGNRAIWIVDRETGLVRFCIGAGDERVSAACSLWTAEGSRAPRSRPGAAQAATSGQRFSGEVPAEGNRAIWVLDHATGRARFCLGAKGDGVTVECSAWAGTD